MRFTLFFFFKCSVDNRDNSSLHRQDSSEVEGDFSKVEKEFLKPLEVFRLDTPMVLRSESAVMAVASKVLL